MIVLVGVGPGCGVSYCLGIRGVLFPSHSILSMVAVVIVKV